MGSYGENFPYGMSRYKDDGSPGVTQFVAVEPIILVTFENRAFYFSHRDDENGDREYRLGEFLKRGQFKDKFIHGA